MDEDDFFITGASVILSKAQKSARVNIFPNPKILFFHSDLFPFGTVETEILVDYSTNSAFAISAEKKCQKLNTKSLEKEWLGKM